MALLVSWSGEKSSLMLAMFAGPSKRSPEAVRISSIDSYCVMSPVMDAT
ncbi:hypothetical protein [Microbacterium suaedae]|nr:hypothetical protein [Microbacterium suaedae]